MPRFRALKGAKLNMQTVKSFGVASVAKTFTIIWAIFGVLTIPITWITNRTTSGSPALDLSWFSPFHLLLIIGIAALLGLFYGAVGAVVYNLVARWTGGIKVEL